MSDAKKWALVYFVVLPILSCSIVALAHSDAVTAFTPFPHASPVVLAGHFQSCPDADDQEEHYGELAYEHQQMGKIRWTLHMGPRDEWALYVGSPSDHFAHDSVFNRLGPAFHYDDIHVRLGGRNWSALGLHVNVIRVPTSDDACYGFLVQVTADPLMKMAKQ